MIVVGLVSLLLTGCGGGDDVPEGREGLTVIKTRADRGLAQATAERDRWLKHRPVACPDCWASWEK